MSQELEIQAEVEALRERFSDTKTLYREVCALLFFRHGITPTASKLYQHVRKGSMSAPAEALAKFWEELRHKARVEIDHPDLPDTLKQAAGQAVSVLWAQATELAREELKVLRVEARTEVQSAQAVAQEAQQQNTTLEAQIQATQDKAIELESRLQGLAGELDQERRAHAASNARGDALSRQVDELKHVGRLVECSRSWCGDDNLGIITVCRPQAHAHAARFFRPVCYLPGQHERERTVRCGGQPVPEEARAGVIRPGGHGGRPLLPYPIVQAVDPVGVSGGPWLDAVQDCKERRINGHGGRHDEIAVVFEGYWQLQPAVEGVRVVAACPQVRDDRAMLSGADQNEVLRRQAGGGLQRRRNARCEGDRRHRRLAQFERSQIEASFLAGKAQLGKLIKRHHSFPPCRTIST